MSIKIYTAYRFPLDRLVPFQEWVRPQMIERVHEEIRTLASYVLAEAVEAHWARGRWVSWATREMVERYFRAERALHLARIFSDHTGISIDCGWNLWPYEGHWYAIPYGALPCDDMELPSWVEDYSYWDNTDRPAEVGAREWKRRGRVWDMVCLGGRGGWNKHRLQFSVVDMDAGSESYGELLGRYIRRAPEVTGIPKLVAPEVVHA